MDEIKLSLKQIEFMKHAIGFDGSRIKKEKYEAYRNRYYSNGLNDDWEYLVKKGLAERRNSCPFDGNTMYFVSTAGLEYLGSLFGCTIVETD